MVTDTSVESYRKLKLGPNQTKVHHAITMLGAVSNRDIANYLDWSINEVTGRVKELRDYGVVVEAGKKYDPETSRRVMTWCVSDPYAKRKIDVINKADADDQPKAVSWLND